MRKPTINQLKAAARWWADRLLSPKFDNLGPTRGQNTHETEVNTFASILAGLNASHTSVTPQQLQWFQESLVNIANDREWLTGFHVDYDPDTNLALAASAAGVSDSRFPWKSHTWFTVDGRVEAACGYGSSVETIYS